MRFNYFAVLADVIQRIYNWACFLVWNKLSQKFASEIVSAPIAVRNNQRLYYNAAM